MEENLSLTLFLPPPPPLLIEPELGSGLGPLSTNTPSYYRGKRDKSLTAYRMISDHLALVNEDKEQ